MGLKLVTLAGGKLRPAFLAAACFLAACSLGDGGEDVTAQPSPDDTATAAPRYVVPDQASFSPAAGETAGQVDAASWRIKPPFYAAGSEPDWRLDLIDGWFVFQRSGLAEIDAPASQPDQTGAADVFASETMIVSLSAGLCETESVGARAVGVAEITFDNITYAGCAYAGQSPAISAVSTGDAAWKRDLAGRMIEVDACLAALESRYSVTVGDVVITATYPRADEVLGVILRERSGRLFDCGVESSGEVAFLDPLAPEQASEWSEARGLFYRAENEPPPEACFEDAEELAVDDVTLGYFLPEGCGF